MRVISGRARGHTLQALEGLSTRPTTDRIKETIFNIISFDIRDARFLDLFSGTGAIGIEALSREAAHAVFVDNNAEAVAVIQKNLQSTRLNDKATILKTDFLNALVTLGRQKQPFDIIFMDPPYGQDDVIERALSGIASHNLLAEGGFVMIEQAAIQPLPYAQGFSIFKTKQFKTTTILFLQQQLQKE